MFSFVLPRVSFSFTFNFNQVKPLKYPSQITSHLLRPANGSCLFILMSSISPKAPMHRLLYLSEVALDKSFLTSHISHPQLHPCATDMGLTSFSSKNTDVPPTQSLCSQTLHLLVEQSWTTTTNIFYFGFHSPSPNFLFFLPFYFMLSYTILTIYKYLHFIYCKVYMCVHVYVYTKIEFLNY